MIELGTPVLWKEPGKEPIRGIVEMIQDDWYAIQWENGSYTRYQMLRKYEQLSPDFQTIRIKKLGLLGI